MIIVRSSFFKMSSVHTNTKSPAAFSNPSGLKSVFEKLRFRDGLLTVEIKLDLLIACKERRYLRGNLYIQTFESES